MPPLDSDGHHCEDLKVCEDVAPCAGGAASTTGYWKGENDGPTLSSAALGDSNTHMHLAIGILAACIGKLKTGKGLRASGSIVEVLAELGNAPTRAAADRGDARGQGGLSRPPFFHPLLGPAARRPAGARGPIRRSAPFARIAGVPARQRPYRTRPASAPAT